ncbi:hypothetical protein B0H12DRAFT_1149067 [Mycena haematopus]|nr:hypothetical protein B0H12DRAFT_1149067 [Mycena haematopus]
MRGTGIATGNKFVESARPRGYRLLSFSSLFVLILYLFALLPNSSPRPLCLQSCN